jgi:hypothetical protein
MNGVDPFGWFKQMLERLAASWPNRHVEALMPWSYIAWTAVALCLR